MTRGESKMAFDPMEQYGDVRGFNFQPDWSSNGIGVWLQFDGTRYRELIRRGRKFFPKMNTLRIWLSFNAWCENSGLYLKNIEKAAEIIEQEGLRFIPVYLNGWFGVPSFGGFVPEMLFSSYRRNNFGDFRSFIAQSAQAVSSDGILIHDICNEPFNCAWGREINTKIVRDFLGEMCTEVRKVDGKPITVGSQGSVRSLMPLPDIKSKWGDIDLLAPMVDVITLHPYCIPPMTRQEHWDCLIEVLEYIKGIGKPLIITECCWAGITDEDRLPFLEIELPHYAKLGMGFCVHALCDSPVADLHPLDNGKGLGALGIYMAFVNACGEIRKGHEMFNQL